ncbi:hypothetical protein J2X19_003992 [Rhodoferax ferrireducens]|uniref:DUF1302 domain-containing protein n=1 Tax=Rhodoferax ferrireducens TaxID=192843 RepID=A0ABU2CD92_9BURK|nr:DUF1302 family protein [Rhodoferax ferrireducens]MDR7379298.1 hypothetical protein [Rhodoferax ferrireducens]
MRVNTARQCRIAAAVAAALSSAGVYAMELDLPDSDWAVRFDNTVKGGLMYRTQQAAPELVNSFRLLTPGVPASAFPYALNLNAGDDNFRDRGLVSKRVDLLSELDAVYRKDFGLRLSASAWYDAAYDGTTQAVDSSNGQNPTNQFARNTLNLAGRKAELMDVFVFGSWDLSSGRKLSLRLGRHALQYGESLFFGENGIARAQGPIDVHKLLSSPNAQFKESLRPVPQLSGQLQVTPEVAVSGYVQFRWEADRLPPAGSYFSASNLVWGNPTLPQFLGVSNVGNFVLQPSGDHKPKDSGQFGMQLKWRLEDTDLGFYAARYHDKSGQLYGQLDLQGPTGPGGTLPGNWYYLFPEAVKVYGVSATQSFGDFNFAAEGSIRSDMPLRSPGVIYGFFPGQPEQRYAKGRTAHINLSTLANFGPSFIARESSLVAEIAWNRVLHMTDPDGAMDKDRTRDAAALQLVFTPSYRQIVSGLDLSVPIGLRYTLDGRSAVTTWDARGSGNASIGLTGNYLGVWQFGLTYTHYIGKAASFIDYSPSLTGGTPRFGQGNAVADRNFVSLTLSRTF